MFGLERQDYYYCYHYHYLYRNLDRLWEEVTENATVGSWIELRPVLLKNRKAKLIGNKLNSLQLAVFPLTFSALSSSLLSSFQFFPFQVVSTCGIRAMGHWVHCCVTLESTTRVLTLALSSTSTMALRRFPPKIWMALTPATRMLRSSPK